jgi:hypothetical protein
MDRRSANRVRTTMYTMDLGDADTHTLIKRIRGHSWTVGRWTDQPATLRPQDNGELSVSENDLISSRHRPPNSSSSGGGGGGGVKHPHSSSSSIQTEVDRVITDATVFEIRAVRMISIGMLTSAAASRAVEDDDDDITSQRAEKIFRSKSNTQITLASKRRRWRQCAVDYLRAARCDD